MKVIFLDIDGVLNGRRFVPKDDKVGVLIDDSPFAEGVFRNRFVLTSRLRYGMDEDDAKKAVSILGSNTILRKNSKNTEQ